MAAFNRFNVFSKDLVNGTHKFGSDVFKVMLSNVLPVATFQVLTDITEIVSGGTTGYTAGGTATTLTLTTTAAITKAAASNVTFTGGAGTMGPFQYAVLYNTTPTSPLKPLIAWWDYGTPITLANTEQFVVGFDATNGVFTLA